MNYHSVIDFSFMVTVGRFSVVCIILAYLRPIELVLHAVLFLDIYFNQWLKTWICTSYEKSTLKWLSLLDDVTFQKKFTFFFLIYNLNHQYFVLS